MPSFSDSNLRVIAVFALMQSTIIDSSADRFSWAVSWAVSLLVCGDKPRSTFDFLLAEVEMSAIRALDKGKGMHDPDKPGVAEWLLANYKIHG